MSESVYFKVDGQWFTDFIRNLYYAENKTYEECKQKLCKSLCLADLSEEEKEELSETIIFGEKKLVGINDFYLVDDVDFDVYNYSRFSRPKNFIEGEGIIGILTKDGIFVECQYGGHFSTINWIDNGNQECAGAFVFSRGNENSNESSYVESDNIFPPNKHQIKWYLNNKKYLNDRQRHHFEKYIK
ncbi:hypothetical protein SAMN05444401_1752 [Clostridium amylolyticum]|uniref:Uncharacterized protein n=1 Tax=Clostridium amylolyticum TaxID=1121298 RepID=A0A1M6EZH1_9CLOT|nr:hypothetical protein [Clostridium amylolyticum]SHI90868.1 hypothetical protein SAMN05444401_1752 [Clostridium amylolyticum]